MILPNKFPAPQEVMDLQQIPSSSLPPIAKDLRISYLNNIQTQLYHTFMNTNSNIFVGSAEGTGKFTLALFAAFKCLYQEGKKVVFLFPKDSALTGKSEDLGKILRKKVGRTYGELAKDSGILLAMDVILTTPEAWDAISRRWRARKGFDQIGLFVIENLHMLSEGLSTLEVVVSRMRYISSQMGEKSFRMIGLSTSVADYNELGQWMGATPETTFNFHPKIRQNNVETIFYSYDQHIRQSRLYMMQKNLVNKVKYYNRNCIIFVNDSKQMKLTALDCVSLLSLEEDHKKLRKFSDKELKHITKNISDQYLVHVLEYGIGYLYDGMKEQEKQIIINLFKTEGIGLLVVTQSLKWELALKAFMVVVLDVCYYRVVDQRWCDYSIVDMLQFMSFSSTSEKDKNRGKQYNHAKFIIMCHSAKKPFYKKFLFEPIPIESSLHLHLTNHLNSSMVSKSIETKQDCIDWLTWTFMYRRLIHNPNYYNMQEVSEEGISTFLSELIEKNVEYLENVKCLEVENQMDLTPTNLGIVCSYYYVRVETLSAFLEHIVENMKLVSIMEMVCEAEELSVFGYRPHEHHLINQILVSIHEKANNKAYGLMLMYLHRVSVSGELAQEIRRMLPIWVKLTHSLVDVITSFGYLKPLILAMQLCKMLVQAMWIDDSQLLQVMDGQVAELLDKQYGVKDIGEFANMDDEARDAALTGKDVNRIAEACNRYPAVTVEYEVLGEEDGEVGVKVTLARDDELDEKAMKVICPYYSESKDEYWWVLIGDKKTNRVLTTKRVLLLKSQATLEVQFQPIEGCQVYTLYALCDSYIGCDQVEEFSL